MPGDSMSGIVQVLPSLRINSTDRTLSSAEPPVTRIPFNIFWQLYLYLRKEFTWLMWNFLITVAVQRFPCCNVLNPVLHLCNSCINSMTGTFIAITYYPNLWVPTESTLFLKASKSLKGVFKIWKITGLRNRINVITFHSLVQLVVHQSPLDMSHCHGHQHKCEICINDYCVLLFFGAQCFTLWFFLSSNHCTFHWIPQ